MLGHGGVHLIVKLPAISFQACKFTKNELFHAHFPRILARFQVIYCAFFRNHFMVHGRVLDVSMGGGGVFQMGGFIFKWGGLPIRGINFGGGGGRVFEKNHKMGALHAPPPTMGNPGGGEFTHPSLTFICKILYSKNNKTHLIYYHSTTLLNHNLTQQNSYIISYLCVEL